MKLLNATWLAGETAMARSGPENMFMALGTCPTTSGIPSPLHRRIQFRQLKKVLPPRWGKSHPFKQMSDIPAEVHAPKNARGGRPDKLPAPEMLVMALEYLREYRTCSISAPATAARKPMPDATICRVEDTPVKSGAFALPSKKKSRPGNRQTSRVIPADATETPVEHPKKSENGITPVKITGM